MIGDSHEVLAELTTLLWFAGVLAALALLFAAGLRTPVRMAPVGRLVSALTITAAAIGATIVANVALFRHDTHLDLTREKAFTPSAEAQDIVRNLSQRVDIAYFYQAQNPGARALNAMLLQLERLNANFHVRLVDADRNPALASAQGVRTYNAAVLTFGGRRVEAITTDDREIGLAVLRLLRQRETIICFVSGHGEYDIDNFEFHTHFEGTHSHNHDAQGLAVVQMEQHGLGRLRRALEKLGLGARKVVLASGQKVPGDCAALVDANPRTRYTAPEARTLRAYLDAGGAAMFMLEPDYVLDDSLADVLASIGIAVRDGVVVDPREHYFTDEQMIAVTHYGDHAVTRGLALSFYPGARPLEQREAGGVTTTALFSSSPESYVIADRLGVEKKGEGKPHRSEILALAAEGTTDGRRFRAIVFGDADFASNSFFPYLANSDVVLASLSWLIREERAPAMKPPVEVLPTVTLTNAQMRSIFIVTVLFMPGFIVAAGGVVWWRRRR